MISLPTNKTRIKSMFHTTKKIDCIVLQTILGNCSVICMKIECNDIGIAKKKLQCKLKKELNRNNYYFHAEHYQKYFSKLVKY